MMDWIIERCRTVFPGGERTGRKKAVLSSAGTFDPALIPRFQEHHGTLLQLIDDLTDCVERRRYQALPGILTIFRRELMAHMLDENTRLYNQLKLRDLPDDGAAFASGMQHEMARMSVAISMFTRSYAQLGVSDRNVGMFKTELNAIRAALQDRLWREETLLYPMYLESPQCGVKTVAA